MVVTLVAKAAWGLGVVKGSPCTFIVNIPDILLFSFQRTFPSLQIATTRAATRHNRPTSTIRLAQASPAPPTRENPTTPSTPTAVSQEHQVTG